MSIPSPFEFEGLAGAEEAIADAGLTGEANYVRILRIDNAKTMPQIGRRQWDRTDMAQYLHEDGEGGADGFDSTRNLFEDGLDVDDPADSSGEGTGRGNAAKAKEADHRAMAAAMIRWIQEIIRGQMGPDADVVVFKIEVRGPKGETTLAAPRIRCRRLAASALAAREPPSIEPTIPLNGVMPGDPTPVTMTNLRERAGAPDPGLAAWEALTVAWNGMVSGHMRSMGLLQAGYTHQMRLNLNALHDVRDANSLTTRALADQVRRLARENADKDGLITRLADELISFRIDLAGLGMTAQGDRDTSKERLAFANKALGEMGKLGELYLAGKLDIEPELVGLLMVVRENPKLLACLKNPKVHLALKNADVQATIIDALESVAASIPDEAPPAPPTDPEKTA